MVSERPRSCTPRAQAGGCPRRQAPHLAEHTCGRDHDAYGERGAAGQQQQFMKKLAMTASRAELHPVSSTIRNSQVPQFGTRKFHNSELVS
jgi:hypothetical protein